VRVSPELLHRERLFFFGVAPMRTRASTTFTANVSIRNAGTPMTQPVATSYCQSHDEHLTTRSTSFPAASDDPQRIHKSSMANIRPLILHSTTAVSSIVNAIGVLGVSLSAGPTSTKCVARKTLRDELVNRARLLLDGEREDSSWRVRDARSSQFSTKHIDLPTIRSADN
jgi:hypothetical protein